MNVGQIALKLILYIAIGYAGRKLRVMGDGFDKLLTNFLISIPVPCMIVKSFDLEFDPARLVACPELLGLSALSMLICFALAQLVFRLMGRGSAGKAARFALIFTNFTFLGFAVVNELYGAEASFYYVIFTLLIRVLFYGGAPVLLGENLGFDGKQALKQLNTPPIYALFIGLLLYITQWQLPTVVDSVVRTLSSMAGPLGLMLCGIIIADARFAGMTQYPCVFWLTALRLLGMPLLMLGVFLLLGVDHEIIRSLNYYFAMPVPSFLPVFLLRYNPEDTTARSVGGYLVVLSTLLCTVTIPLWTLLLERVL